MQNIKVFYCIIVVSTNFRLKCPFRPTSPQQKPISKIGKVGNNFPSISPQFLKLVSGAFSGERALRIIPGK